MSRRMVRWTCGDGVTPAAGLKETVLLKTTKDSQLVDGMMASFSGENILKDFKPAEGVWPTEWLPAAVEKARKKHATALAEQAQS